MSFIQKKIFNKKAFNLQVNIKGAQKLKMVLVTVSQQSGLIQYCTDTLSRVQQFVSHID